jgi:hypothetical protein
MPVKRARAVQTKVSYSKGRLLLPRSAAAGFGRISLVLRPSPGASKCTPPSGLALLGVCPAACVPSGVLQRDRVGRIVGGAGLDLEAGGRLGRLPFAHTWHLWWGPRWARRLLAVAGARCPLTKPAVAAIELQAAIEPHSNRGVQPGGICACVGAACKQRGLAPGGLWPGRRPGHRCLL